MSDRFGPLVDQLSADLAPVRRLRPPLVRSLIWLTCALAFGVALTSYTGLQTSMRQFALAPDLGLTAAASILTAILAAVAAFQLSLPDRSSAWALAPAPGVVLWLSASGWGCMRSWGAPGFAPATAMDGVGCVSEILGVSIPLSLLLLVLLHRSHPLRPGLVAAVGGVAAAAASVGVLSFNHPHDASAIDVLMHVVAVAVVVGAARVWGGRALAV